MEQPIFLFVFFFIPLFVVGGVLFLVLLILDSKLYKILETEHPQAYEQMGRPTLSSTTTPKSGWLLVKFVMKKEYLELNNPKLQKLGEFIFVCTIAYWSILGVFIVSFLIFPFFFE